MKSTMHRKDMAKNGHQIEEKNKICHTWGINSLTGSLTTFRGEPKWEGPTLCFIMRGEPDELLGDSGGALPAGNMDGKALLALACGLEEFPCTFKGPPAFASLSNCVTWTHKVTKHEIISIQSKQYFAYNHRSISILIRTKELISWHL